MPRIMGLDHTTWGGYQLVLERWKAYSPASTRHFTATTTERYGSTTCIHNGTIRSLTQSFQRWQRLETCSDGIAHKAARTTPQPHVEIELQRLDGGTTGSEMSKSPARLRLSRMRMAYQRQSSYLFTGFTITSNFAASRIGPAICTAPRKRMRAFSPHR